MEWDVDKQGVAPATTPEEQAARDKRYEHLQDRRALPGLDFLQSVVAILIPSVRHVREAKESKKAVQFGTTDPKSRFRGTINL